MSELLRRPEAPDARGRYLHVTPANAGWRYVGFDAYDLRPGATLELDSGGDEICMVLLSGKANVVAGDASCLQIGERMSVFEDRAPYAVYAPNDCRVSVAAISEIELAVCRAPGRSGHEPRLITPEEIGYERRGTGSNTRHIRNILPEEAPADSLLVVEVRTPPGNWSSYPPHKHDSDDLPRQSYLEETYYHRIDPPQGFAFQRVYTEDGALDETMTVHDRDLVLVPRGYHPYGAPHGYTGYYLNVMAGPARVWRFHNDPRHEWMLS